MLKQIAVEYEFPVILGGDYAGVVEQVVSDVTRYSVGDEVFGFLLHANPTAEAVDVAIAGAAPLAGITATLAIDALELSDGDTALIVGATGRTLVMAAPTPENLERLAHLLADGTLRVHIQDTYELTQAPDALTALAATHMQGKLSIRTVTTLSWQLEGTLRERDLGHRRARPITPLRTIPSSCAPFLPAASQ
jgi:NADPH:quinone reductase-like Zn-dependent oxidoreductase